MTSTRTSSKPRPQDADSLQGTLTALTPLLAPFMPDFEIRLKAEQVYEINLLKRARGAVILGHNYMEPALYHGVADYVGDSLQLSRIAATTEADPIVFLGVRFMAETAKVLNPGKTVLLPSAHGGCSLAQSVTAEDVRALKDRFPGVPVVVYINTYSEVHAEADAVCTSSNAAQVVSSFDSDRIIFLPDEYLARNVAAQTGKKVISASRQKLSDAVVSLAPGEMAVWNGRCEVHEQFRVDDIVNIRRQFPGVYVLAHPECSPEVVAAADFSGSTSRMVEEVKKSNATHYLVLTECSMGDNIIAANPDKEVLRMCSVRCPHMGEITLAETLTALQENQHIIEVPEETRVRARKALDRMLSV